MTWTYSGNPANSPLDAVRYQIGDTQESDPLLSNEEIQYELARSGNDVLRAAVKCCEAIAARFARLANSTIGKTSIQAEAKFKQYTQKTQELRRQVTSRGIPYVGGTDTSASFSKGMMDYVDAS